MGCHYGLCGFAVVLDPSSCRMFLFDDDVKVGDGEVFDILDLTGGFL